MKQLAAQMSVIDKPYKNYPFTHKCKLVVDYTPADARVRDVDGMLSALCHVLAKAGIVKDDGLIRDVEWHEFPIDREQPMAVVTIRRLA
jgi:Holliday junction resolvase RusA-like endonuclease